MMATPYDSYSDPEPEDLGYEAYEIISTDKQSKFTPGPWHSMQVPHPECEPKYGLTGFKIFDAVGEGVIAEIFPRGYLVHVNEANARLIAKAPELYAELAACVALLLVGGHHNSAEVKRADKLLAAIEKGE